MGGTRLIEHLQHVYGPLEGRTAYHMEQVENGKKALVELSGLT